MSEELKDILTFIFSILVLIIIIINHYKITKIYSLHLKYELYNKITEEDGIPELENKDLHYKYNTVIDNGDGTCSVREK